MNWRTSSSLQSAMVSSKGTDRPMVVITSALHTQLLRVRNKFLWCDGQKPTMGGMECVAINEHLLLVARARIPVHTAEFVTRTCYITVLCSIVCTHQICGHNVTGNVMQLQQSVSLWFTNEDQQHTSLCRHIYLFTLFYKDEISKRSNS